MADVTVDGSISTATARAVRNLVFTSNNVGYCFYVDSDGTFGYSKTTDGGATWGAQVEVASATTHLAFDVWFDQWTPSDTGTLIHMWYFDTTNDDVFWRTLNTSNDSLGTQRVVFGGGTAVAGRGVFVSGTKTISGYLYCAFDIDAGAERGLHRSTDGGTNWSANLATTFVEATIDQCQLFPAVGTGDLNDCWAIYQDASADALTMKMWDSSAAAEVESSTMQTMVEQTTDLEGPMGFDGALNASTGRFIVVSCSERDTATADMQVWDVTQVNAGSLVGITAKTNITTNIDDNYYPQVFIDQNTNDIYVAYNGKSDGSETMGLTTKIYYRKSTDGGTTWDAEQLYQEGTANAAFQVWAPVTGPRFYVTWRVGTTLIGNKVNSVSFATQANGNSAGVGSSSVAGNAIGNAAASAVGVAASVVVGAAFFLSSFVSTGVGAASADGGTVFQGEGSSIGVSTANADTQTIFPASFESSGVGSATANSQATAGAVGDSAGSGVGTGVGVSTFAGVGSSVGVGAASADGENAAGGSGALLTDLISYWKLDEASGTRIDSHGSNDLTDNNTVGSAEGGARFIKANGEYLSHASNASLKMSGNTDWTIVALVKFIVAPEFPSFTSSIVSKDDDSPANQRDYTLDWCSGGGLPGVRTYIKGGGTWIARDAETSISVDNYYFFVGWYDSSNGQLHIQIDDGTIFDSAASATGTDESDAEFRLGARVYAGNEDYFDGILKNVGIWKRVLTSQEKTDLFNGLAYEDFGAADGEADANSAGVGAASGVGAAIFNGAASSSGSCTVSADGLSFTTGVFSSAGLGTGSAQTLALFNSVGASSGVGAATGVASATWHVVASAAGVATVSGDSDESGFYEVDANAAGVGAATGVGVTYFLSTGNASGLGVGTGVGRYFYLSTGNSAGVGTGIAVGVKVFSTTGSVSGLGIATGVSASRYSVVGSATGLGQAAAIGVSRFTGVANAQGIATVLGDGFDVSSVQFIYIVDLTNPKSLQSSLDGQDSATPNFAGPRASSVELELTS